MLTWLINNIATVIVGAVVLLLIASVIVYLVNQKKKGKSGCGCGCSDCSACPGCSTKSE